MQERKIKKTDPDRLYRNVLAASTLTGNSVRNSVGDDLGTIDEIMIHIPSGRVAYAVLSFGGILGIGSKLFAVPWSALQVDEDKKCFVLDADKKTLESAPGFDKDNWPDMTDTAWGSEIYAYYGIIPYWEEYPERKTLHGGGSL
jgi:sporulation protein YlmC with PRC-barrel domain